MWFLGVFFLARPSHRHRSRPVSLSPAHGGANRMGRGISSSVFVTAADICVSDNQGPAGDIAALIEMPSARPRPASSSIFWMQFSPQIIRSCGIKTGTESGVAAFRNALISRSPHEGPHSPRRWDVAIVVFRVRVSARERLTHRANEPFPSLRQRRKSDRRSKNATRYASNRAASLPRNAPALGGGVGKRR